MLTCFPPSFCCTGSVTGPPYGWRPCLIPICCKKTVKQVACQDIKRHRLSLHQLLHSYDVRPGACEVISGGACPPNKADSFHVQIASSREESKEEDWLDPAVLQVYLDG